MRILGIYKRFQFLTLHENNFWYLSETNTQNSIFAYANSHALPAYKAVTSNKILCFVRLKILPSRLWQIVYKIMYALGKIEYIFMLIIIIF